MTVNNQSDPEIHISEEKLQKLGLDSFGYCRDFHDYRRPCFPIG